MSTAKAIYKGIEEHVFRSDDLHTLMDLVDAYVRHYPSTPESAGYITYLGNLKEKVTALWLEVLPGQEAVCTIREQTE